MIFILFQSVNTRQIYAIIKSLEPTIMSLPWIMLTLKVIIQRSRKRKIGSSEELIEVSEKSTDDHEINIKVMDDAMRNEVVEYLLKGIRKSIISYADSNKNNDPEINEGIINRVIKLLFGDCTINENYENSRISMHSEIADQSNSIYKHIDLLERKSIIKESKREVLSFFTIANI